MRRFFSSNTVNHTAARVVKLFPIRTVFLFSLNFVRMRLFCNEQRPITRMQGLLSMDSFDAVVATGNKLLRAAKVRATHAYFTQLAHLFARYLGSGGPCDRHGPTEQRSLIAMYAGALGDNAVERYALFLTSLALSADHVERRAALQRAREHGRDLPRVAIVMAERTIERALDSLPSSVKGQLPNLANVAQEPAEEAEMLLVRSIEWTVVESETYDTAAGAGERDLEVPTRCADFTSSSVARGEYSVASGTARP